MKKNYIKEAVLNTDEEKNKNVVESTAFRAIYDHTEQYNFDTSSNLLSISDSSKFIIYYYITNQSKNDSDHFVLFKLILKIFVFIARYRLSNDKNLIIPD